VDSHGHLQSDRFEDPEAIAADARAAGVERLLIPGWNAWSSGGAVALAERLGWADAAVGIHPHDAAREGDDAWAAVVAWSRHARVVAIGETGLDYDRMFSPIPDQLSNLRRHLALALETGKPAILHVRSAPGRADAQEALVAELGAAGVGSAASVAAFGERPPAVIHSFSGSVDFARAALDLGLAISISGLAFRAGEEATADVVPLVPAGRLLVETDSPYLTPPGGPKGRNVPGAVGITAAWVAERRGEGRIALGDALVAAYDRLVGRA
jgi:TatD DNase family protein